MRTLHPNRPSSYCGDSRLKLRETSWRQLGTGRQRHDAVRLEIPLDDLKGELENRLDEYVPSGAHTGNIVIDEASLQRVSEAFQVETTRACANCGTTVVLEIKREPTQPRGLLLFKPWTLVHIRTRSAQELTVKPETQPEVKHA